MRKNILLFILVVLSACSNKEKVKFTGKIENFQSASKIFLYEQRVSESRLIDSSAISEKGVFKFKIKITEPGFYLLRLGSSGLVNLLLSPGENVNMTLDASKLPSSISVSGSTGTKQILQIIQKHDSVLVHLDSLRAQYRRIKDPANTKEQVSILESDFNKTKSEERKNTIRFIIENYKSMASILALYIKYDSTDYVLEFPKDLQYYKIVSDSLSKKYPSSKQVKALKNDFDNMMKVQKSEETKRIIKNASSTFPEIALPNIKGDTIRLSKFKGKVILLSFWSYESKACLMTNRDFMGLYKKYSKSGLVIYQLSIDSDKSKWLEAVKDIPWISVAEITSAKSYYAGVFNITGIPTSFIIDQKGTILAKEQNVTIIDRTISDLLKK